jgi:hypothetical protein
LESKTVLVVVVEATHYGHELSWLASDAPKPSTRPGFPTAADALAFAQRLWSDSAVDVVTVETLRVEVARRTPPPPPAAASRRRRAA